MTVNNDLQLQINELRFAEDKGKKMPKRTIELRLYSKRFNYLIHGLPESNENAWETREQTKIIF